MKWKKILSFVIVSVLVFSVLATIGSTAQADGEPLEEIRFDVTLEMTDGAAAAAAGTHHVFMHAVDGPVYQGLPSDTLIELDSWEVFGGYNPYIVNPAHEGPGTDAIEAADWIDDPDDVKYIGNDLNDDWILNPFAHNGFRFAFHYLNREEAVEDLLGGFGEPRYGSFLSSSELWMTGPDELDTSFWEEINEPYGMGPEGDLGLAEAMIEWSMNDMAEHIAEVGHGEISGDMDGWEYAPPGESSDPVELRLVKRIEDWRDAWGDWTADILEDWGFEVDVISVELAGYLDYVRGGDEPFDNLNWHIATEGWISTAISAYHHWGNAYMYFPWYGGEPTAYEMPEGHYNYGIHDADSRIGPSSEFRDAFDLPESTVRYETLAEADEDSDALCAGDVADTADYYERMIELESAGIQEAVRIMFVSGLDFYPYNREKMIAAVPEAIAGYDTYFGPRTMRTDDARLDAMMMTGDEAPYMDEWNLYGGSDDVYGEYQRRTLRELGAWYHPQRGTIMQVGNYWQSEYADEDRTQVFERHGELDTRYVDEDWHTIPDDAVNYVPGGDDGEWMTRDELADLDPEDYPLEVLEDDDTNDWNQAGVKITLDVHDYYIWHDGQHFSLQDTMFNYARVRELGYEDVNPFYGETADLNRGFWDAVDAMEWNEEDGTVTIYGEYAMPVEGLVGQFFSMGIPEAHPTTYWGWDYLHWSNDGEYSYGDGGTNKIHQLIDAHCDDMLDELDDWYDELPPMLREDRGAPIPMELSEWQDSIDSVEEFIDERGHAFISIGPFELVSYDEDTFEMEISRFDDYGYPQPGESAHDVLDRAGIPEDEWDDHTYGDMGDYEFEFGYWSEQFLIEAPRLDTMDIPASVDIGDTYDVSVSGVWEMQFPEPAAESMEGQINDYRVTIRDSVLGDIEHVIGSEDITADHNGDTLFTASDIEADLPAEEYYVHFEVQVEAGDPWGTHYITESISYDEPTERFEVEITAPEDGAEYEEGDTVTVEYTIENTGAEEGTQDIVFSVDGVQEDSVEVTLEVDGTYDGEFEWEADDDGDIELEVASDDDSDSVTITVEEEDPDVPGFTLAMLVLGAVVAVVVYYKKEQ